jgi:hypothetical protein
MIFTDWVKNKLHAFLVEGQEWNELKGILGKINILLWNA